MPPQESTMSIYARLSQIGFTILKFPIMPLRSALKLNL